MKSYREELIETITDFGALCYRHGREESNGASMPMQDVDDNHARREQAMAKMKALITGVEHDADAPVVDKKMDEDVVATIMRWRRENK
jgi:hypothetical protein